MRGLLNRTALRLVLCWAGLVALDAWAGLPFRPIRHLAIAMFAVGLVGLTDAMLAWWAMRWRPPAWHEWQPKPGQVWRSEHSGRCILVYEVRRTDGGVEVVTVCYEMPDNWPGAGMAWGIPTDYAYGMRSWRGAIREERRRLVRTLPLMADGRPSLWAKEWPRK